MNHTHVRDVMPSLAPQGAPPAPVANLGKGSDMKRLLPRALMAPAVVTLFLWMIVPLLMTLYFSFVGYNLLQPGEHPFIGIENFHYFVTDPDFWPAVSNTLMLIGSVIAITVVLGIGLALLVNEPFPGRGIVRGLLSSPFFVTP